jgi:hypothetical protein
MLVAALAMPMFAEKMTPEEKANADYSGWLPASGEFFLGFSVDPFANFIGQMFSNGGATPNSYTRGQYNIGGQRLLTAPLVSIMGGYMLTDNLAIKANIGLIIDYQREIANVLDDKALFLDPLARQIVNDVKISTQYGGSFSAGVEYRVGQKRVQGVFGGGLVYAFQTNLDTYSYGNGITEINQAPTTAYGDPTIPSGVYAANPEPGIYSAARVLKDGVTAAGANNFWHRIGLYTTVGVEWFVAPKIALGLNVNLDLLYRWSNNVCAEYEAYNPLTDKVDHYVATQNMSNYNGIRFGTENIGANLYMNFFF